MDIDRSEVSRAVAKAIAYKQCGKDEEANQWARQVVMLLACHDILQRDPVRMYVQGVQRIA